MASSGSPLTTLHRWGFGNLKVWASLHKYEKYQQAKIAKNEGWASKLQVGVVRQRRTHSCLTLPSTRGYTIFPSSTEECRKKNTFPKLPSTRENTLFTQAMVSGKGNAFFLSHVINTKGIHTFFPLRSNECKKKCIRGRNTFSNYSMKSEKLQVGKGQAPVVEILQSCCDWCCYLSSNQTSFCAQHSILNFGQFHA